MKHPRRAIVVFLSAALVVATLVAPAGAGKGRKGSGKARSPISSNARLQMYEAVVDTSLVGQITSAGYDVVDIEVLPNEQARITLVLRPSDASVLRKMGVDLQVWKSDNGLTSTQLASQQASAGFKVWRDNDGPNGFEQYAHDMAAANPDIVKLEVIGETHGTNPDGGPDTPRDIIALQLTKNANGFAGNEKPAVLYNSLQHAREWISGEVNRRLFEWFIKGYRGGDKQIKSLLTTTELWFIFVSNPDGYQYTFDPDHRLWRKNLRDNDGDNVITSMDGVDPNRNYPEHWGWDDEGSSPEPSSETYRGPDPASEPETQAMINLYDNVDFRFHINYHSVGQWLLYGLGYIMDTPTADDPIFIALSGTDKHPAAQEFNPGLSSSELYVTNGDTNDFAYAQRESLGWVPELSEGPNGDGFVFPDKEGAIQAEFNRLRPFSVSVALSALDPDDPVSSTGIDTKPFYIDVSEIDPQKASNPLSDLTFAHSYGRDQQAQVIAKRDLNNDGVVNAADAVSLNYSINGGSTQTVATSQWSGGDRYGGPGQVYYRFLRGTMNLASVAIGSTVKVWFTGGGHTSDSFTFQVVEKNPPAGDPDHAEVLVLAAEDYTGATNRPAYSSTSGPFFLDYYEQALQDAGISEDDYDVYDVDAMGRTAPSYLGVLNHYDTVIWYTGNDYLTREPGQKPGTGFATLAFREMLEAREYLNEEGNLLYTGQSAGMQYAQGYPFNPVSTPPYCDGHEANFNEVSCRIADDDFLQYWLGSYIYNDDAGLDGDGNPYPLKGIEDPFDTTEPRWDLNGATSADNQESAESFLTTSSLLKPAEYPQFTSDAYAEWDSGVGGPFQPRTGNEYVYSDRADVTYKRISHPTSGGATADFWISYDTEPAWDFVFVEAHNVTDDTWVTLPDANGHTSTSVGDSCPEGWHELHPHLAQHQGADCSGSGWNAASGRSAGWENWHVEVPSEWAGDEVELYISYASDWAIQGLGVFIDDVTLTPGGTTSFEGEDGGWTIPAGPPAGSGANANDFYRTTDVGFEEGAIVGMDPSDADFRSLHFGFGLEGVRTAPEREDLLCRALQYLGNLCTP